MDLEGRVREAMTAHEHEAPSAAEFAASRRAVRPLPRRATRWLPAVAAASVVLAVAIGVVVIRSGDHIGRRTQATDAGTLDCPQEYVSSNPSLPAVWVPARPRGVDASRLVPQQTPTRVLVCAYLNSTRSAGPPAGHSIARTGAVELGGNLSRVAESLTWLPRKLPGQGSACDSSLLVTDGDAYLVGLSYPTGIVWVSAPGNHCAGASNGTFATPANLRASAAAAYAAKRWTVDPSSTQSGDRDPCHVGTAGRLGQEKAMVPDQPVSATICRVPYANQSSANASTQVTNSEAIVAKLNSFATRPTTSSAGCSGDQPIEQSVIYEVLLRYAEGPPVFVRVSPGCQPSIDNLSLQADDSGTVVALLTALLAGR